MERDRSRRKTKTKGGGAPPRRVEIIKKEKYVEVPVIEYREVIVEVPKIEIVEKIIEVPQVEIREVQKEHIIEIPQIEVVEKIVEVPIDQYVELAVEIEKEVIVHNDVHRFTPECYEAVQPYEFRIPTVETEYEIKQIEFYVPRFIQVPLPSYLLTDEQKTEMRGLVDMVDRIAKHPSPSLSDLEQVTEWLVLRQAELKNLRADPQPTKDYFDKMAQRLPTGTFSSNSNTAEPKMIRQASVVPFTLPTGNAVRKLSMSVAGKDMQKSGKKRSHNSKL